MNKHAPFKTKIVRGNDQAHMTKELRKEIMKRSRLKNIYNKSKLLKDFKAFKKQRNRIVTLNSKQKKLYFSLIDTNKSNNSKSFWDYCKPFFTNKSSNWEENKIILKEDDITIGKESNVAHIFNDYFKNITKYLPIKDWSKVNNRSVSSTNKFSTHPSIKITESNFSMNNIFSFKNVDESILLKIINQLDEKKSTSGTISTKLLKIAKNKLLTPLISCINSCIQNQTFPDELKQADIVPIFKKGDPMLKSNYRPISLLPVLSKIFEKIIHIQLSNYFESKLSKKLCGFREKHSTQHAIFQLVTNIQSWLDDGNFVGMVLMDLSKAYDCIPYDLLIAKLKAYGVENNSLNLLKSYLSGREQRVKVNSEYSNFLDVERGIPQGSILGPLLFNIFINDLLVFYKTTDICNFADDNSLYKGDKNLERLKTILTKGIEESIEWLEYNSMIANPEKFQLLILSPKRNIKENLKIYIQDKVLQSTPTVKLLGVTIDQNLTFKDHIINLCITAKNKLKALQRIRKFLTFDQTKMLANSFVYSQFNYCNIIWMFCSKSENNQINEIQKRILRCIYKERNGTLEYLIEKYEESTIHERNLQSLMLLIYRVINNLSPELLFDSFTEKKINYSLRSKSNLRLPESKTNRFGTNSLIFKGSILWNLLPKTFKEAQSELNFKEKIKKWKPKVCTCNICK